MKFLTTILVIFQFSLIHSQSLYPELQDGTNGINNGYGAWGNYNTVHEAEIQVPGKGIINFYHPDIAATQLPVIFFISGWGRYADSYEKLFYYMASLGYSVVNIYNTDPGNINESYQNSLDMMNQAVQNEFPQWIDTGKVGLMGHSYGGGATVWLGKQVFSAPYNWGSNGKFIFMTAPWYSLLITIDDLLNYPSDVKLLIEISNDDMHEGTNRWNTDERAIRAVFELINIPNSEKDFIRIYSSTDTFQYDIDNDGNPETFNYDANHYISYTGTYNSYAHYQTYDALDVYAINRLVHALTDYTFNGNQQAKNICLGNGSTQQVDMDFLTDLEESDAPVISRPENQFQYPCSSDWNDFQTNQNTWFLQEACADNDNDGIIDYIEQLEVKTISENNIRIFPNPAKDFLFIRTNDHTNIDKITLYNSKGQIIINQRKYSGKIDITVLKPGNYFIQIDSKNNRIMKKFVKM